MLREEVLGAQLPDSPAGRETQMKHIPYKLNRFCSPGSFGVLDMNRGRWLVDPLEKNLSYRRAMNAKGYNIIMKPSAQREPFYMPCDDLRIEDMNRDR